MTYFNHLNQITDTEVINFTMFVYLFVCGATAPSGSGPPQSRSVYITHNDAPQSVELLWNSNHFVAETST